jgi:predicted TIM-barrel fold metal-dependent hydrolase
VTDPPPFGLDNLPLVDHHCHGVVARDLDQAAFESFINEGFEAPAPGTSHFDTPIGLGVRRWCAPVLDLEPYAPPRAYVARRRELGWEEANRRFVRAAGIGELLIDTGYRTEDTLAVEGMAAVAGAPGFEVVRIEAVEQRVADGGVDASSYAHAVETALADEAARPSTVGFKSIVAYRGGFDFDPAPPAPGDVERAAAAWLARPGPHRAEDPVLLRHGIWAAATIARDRGMPIQIHTGFGDTDLTLNRTDPTLLTDLLKAFGALPVDVVFLHCYPYQREAGYLASMFTHVYFDVGAVLHYVGPSARTVMAESLELAPFTKQLFSSDAFGVAELYLLGAHWFRRALGDVLQGWIDADTCSTAEAERIVRLIGRENALRIYPLPGADGR